MMHTYTVHTYTCDDCGKAYAGPAYYTFDRERCISTRDEMALGERPTVPEDGWPDNDDWIQHGDDCTGNLCPSCAGPYLDPDDPFDDRRPLPYTQVKR